YSETSATVRSTTGPRSSRRNCHFPMLIRDAPLPLWLSPRWRARSCSAALAAMATLSGAPARCSSRCFRLQAGGVNEESHQRHVRDSHRCGVGHPSADVHNYLSGGATDDLTDRQNHSMDLR